MSIHKRFFCSFLNPEHRSNLIHSFRRKQQAGFTLLELLVAVFVIGALTAIAVPAMRPMWESARYKKAAREIASVLRETRSRAISENLEHEVCFALTSKNCFVRRGDRANGTEPYTSSPASWTQVKMFSLPEGMKIRGNLACDETSSTNFTIQLNPDGTGNNRYLCIEDNVGGKKYASGVSSSTTGRVRIRQWDTTTSNWDP